MEIRFKIAGIEAVVNVKDAMEASNYFASLAGVSAERINNGSSQSNIKSQENGAPLPLLTSAVGPIKVEPTTYQDAPVRKVLQRIRGNPSSKLLLALTKSPNGVKDVVLKEILDLGDDDRSIGPAMANISKQCKKVGIPLEAIVRKSVKRGTGGKMHYKYRISEQAASIIRSIENFTEPAEFPEFEDDDATE